MSTILRQRGEGFYPKYRHQSTIIVVVVAFVDDDDRNKRKESADDDETHTRSGRPRKREGKGFIIILLTVENKDAHLVHVDSLLRFGLDGNDPT